ncbi:hypothetical protein P3H15_42230 [Rhodococcus sp. T2V]|nr:hypothetical protein [Rhodococcus sp. T2V]MDF3311600.1 hypothetical protein [Rhodococcus sp. T2V]
MHSRYRRQLADTATGGHPVMIDLRVRRFFCDTMIARRPTTRRPPRWPRADWTGWSPPSPAPAPGTSSPARSWPGPSSSSPAIPH